MRGALLQVLLIATVAPLGAQAVRRPAITGVAFARFYSTDPPRAQKFYGDTLPKVPVCSGETFDVANHA